MGIFFTKFLIPVLMLVGGIPQKKCQVYYNVAAQQTYDIIIVPGMPYKGIEIDTVMKGRVYWAKHLYESGITKRIMFSGGAVYTKYYEAKVMALYAKKIGIPDSVIYTETKAEHSKENVYYSYKKAMNLGFTEIALATDPHQSKRMRKYIKKNFESMGLIPFVIEILDNGDRPNPRIESKSAIDPNFVSIVDRESFFKRWAGTRGQNINEEYYENGKLE